MWRRCGLIWNRNANADGNGNAMLTMVMRYFSSNSRKRAPNLRKINPRVPFQEAASIAEGLHEVIRINGPLTVSNTWNHAKEAGILGLASKTHMKIMLKWMRGRSMLKQVCNQIGSNKKFLLTSLPDSEGPQQNQSSFPLEPKLKSRKPSKLSKQKSKK